MKNTLSLAVVLAGSCALLGACNGGSSSSQQPAAVVPPAPAPVASTDSLKIKPSPPKPVPFVNGTKAGRVLGAHEPSPPASRTR